MFVLDHAGVEQKYYDSRSAVVCSLAQIPRDLFEELKAVSDAWSVFQETVPTTCIWGWHKSQCCRVARSDVARYSMTAPEPVKRWALSTAEVMCALCWCIHISPLCRTLSLDHQAWIINWAWITIWKNQSFSFFLSLEGPLHAPWSEPYDILITSPFNFIPFCTALFLRRQTKLGSPHCVSQTFWSTGETEQCPSSPTLAGT